MTENQKYSAIVCTVCGIGFLICILLALIFPPRMERQSSTDAVKDEQRGTEASFDVIEMNVSAYCPCEKCCGKWTDGITASGKPAKGLIIAAPPQYPFGTVMDVPGYGRAVVEDRGGAIRGNKIDLLFDTHQEALNFGRQKLEVKVYK